VRRQLLLCLLQLCVPGVWSLLLLLPSHLPPLRRAHSTTHSLFASLGGRLRHDPQLPPRPASVPNKAVSTVCCTIPHHTRHYTTVTATPGDGSTRLLQLGPVQLHG
jgi:hypothetical protein